MNLLDAVKSTKPSVRYYQASSSEMFGKVSMLPVNEKSVLHPVSPYGISKATGHWMAVNYREAYGLFCCSGILFNHESVFRPQHFVTKKVISTAIRIKRGEKKKLTLGNIDIRRDWGYAPEYVKTMWMMLQQDVASEYVIATDEAHSLKEFVELTFSCVGLDWEEHTSIDQELFRQSDIEIIYGNPAKARNLLGWDYRMSFKGLIELLVEDHLRFESFETK
jgi:GDPmannose 4,6-dehydratase